MTTINNTVISKAIQLLQNAPNGIRRADLMSALDIRGEVSEQKLWVLLIERGDLERSGRGAGSLLKYRESNPNEPTPTVIHAWVMNEDEARQRDQERRAREVQDAQEAIMALFEKNACITRRDVEAAGIEKKLAKSALVVLMDSGRITAHGKTKNFCYKKAEAQSPSE